MRKRIAFFFMVALVSLISFSVNAADYDGRIEMINLDNGIIKISGTLKSGIQNRIVSIFVYDKNITITDYDKQRDCIEHIGAAPVSYDGNFSYLFKHTGELNKYYKVDIKCGDEKLHLDSNPFFFVNRDGIEDVLHKIKDGQVTYDILDKYKVVMALNLSPFEEEYKALLVNNLNTRKPATLDEVQKEVNLTSFKEVEVLYGLKSNMKIWNDVEPHLKKYQEYINGINFEKFDLLESKYSVCSGLMGKSFGSIDDLLNEFNRLVNIASKNNDENGKGDNGGRTYYKDKIVKYESDIIQPDNNQESTSIFLDIVDVKWAKPAIEYLYSKNIINGVGNMSFAPNNNVKREELVKMAVIGFDIDPNFAEINIPFNDCSTNAWYFNYVSIAYNKGYINGVEKEKFGISSNITREDLAAIIYRIAVDNGITFKNKKEDFADYNNVSEYAKDAVAYLAGNNIIDGNENNMFNPKSFATRAEAAKILYGVLKY